jgi:hypothetical protein
MESVFGQNHFSSGSFASSEFHINQSSVSRIRKRTGLNSELVSLGSSNHVVSSAVIRALNGFRAGKYPWFVFVDNHDISALIGFLSFWFQTYCNQVSNVFSFNGVHENRVLLKSKLWQSHKWRLLFFSFESDLKFVSCIRSGHFCAVHNHSIFFLILRWIYAVSPVSWSIIWINLFLWIDLRPAPL